MHGAQTATVGNRVASGLVRKDQPKLAQICEDFAAAFESTRNALDSIESSLNRIDGATPQSNETIAAPPSSVTLVDSLQDRVNGARHFAERTQWIAQRLQAIG